MIQNEYLKHSKFTDIITISIFGYKIQVLKNICFFMFKNRMEMKTIPYKFKKPCQFPSCPELTHKRYCKKHNNCNSKGRSKPYNIKWKKARETFLKLNPLCARCLDNGKLIKAVVTDHIIPHRGDMDLFWDRSNWQSLCKSCHDQKTRNEDQTPVYKF